MRKALLTMALVIAATLTCGTSYPVNFDVEDDSLRESLAEKPVLGGADEDYDAPYLYKNNSSGQEYERDATGRKVPVGTSESGNALPMNR